MFLKNLWARRSSKSASCQPVHGDNATPPPPTGTSSSTSQCTSNPTAAKSATREREPDEEVHDYELFLERARTEEEKREKTRQQEIRDARKRREQASMDTWARRI